MSAHLLHLILMFAVSGAPAAAPAGGPEAAPHDINLTISKDTLERLLQAAVPYAVTLDMGLFDERVILTEARDLQLVAGGARLTVKASGSPIPFTAVIVPELRLERDAAGSFAITVRSMPVVMGSLGTYDLASLIEPVPIESLSQYLLKTPSAVIGVDLVIADITISGDHIQVLLRTDFHGIGPPSAGLQGASQAVAKHVERQDGADDGETGEDRQPPAVHQGRPPR